MFGNRIEMEPPNQALHLAHTVLVWTRHSLTPSCPKIARLGIKRLVRDVFQMDRFLIFDQRFDLRHVNLNSADPFAKELSGGLASLLAQEHVAVSLDEIKVAKQSNSATR
jgi:hypothetical protein